MLESSGRMQNEAAKHGASAGYFAGGGEMRDRIRAFDWSKSPLGPIEEWPISLRTIVAVMLGNRYPMAVWWGRDSLQLYNDAFRPILGGKHPASLGSSGLAVWRESWEVLGPMACGVLDGGPATWHEHLLVPADRSGFGEEASFSFSYSPIPTDTGAVGGVLVTAKVQGERTAAEVKLHESEGRYLALFNSIDQGFCTLEVAFDESQKPADYRFLEVSPSFERQTGIRNGAGRWMREIAPGQDEHWFEIYGRVALTGESTRFESYSTPLDRWWAVYAFRIQEPRLRRVGVLFNDITERKRIEQALNDRTAQFQTLVNMAPLGVYLVDGDFRILHVNPIAASVFGAIEGGVEGRAFDEIMHMLWEQEYADEIVRLFRHTLESGESHVTPERAEFRADRGVTEYYEWRIERITMPDSRGNGGRGFGVVCYFRDISAQVRDRQAIRESEERYRGIVNQSLAGIAETDATGRFTIVNDLYCQITGYSREEMLRLRMQDVTHPEDLPRNLQLVEKLAAEGTPFEIEKRYIRKDRSIVWVHNSVSAIQDAHGVCDR